MHQFTDVASRALQPLNLFLDFLLVKFPLFFNIIIMFLPIIYGLLNLIKVWQTFIALHKNLIKFLILIFEQVHKGFLLSISLCKLSATERSGLDVIFHVFDDIFNLFDSQFWLLFLWLVELTFMRHIENFNNFGTFSKLFMSSIKCFSWDAEFIQYFICYIRGCLID